MTLPTPGPVTFERSPDGLGLGSARPRISWRLPEASGSQLAYELEFQRAGLTIVTGRVAAADRHLVPWPAEPLASRERVQVRVRVWTDDEPGASGWSQPAWAEAALLDPGEWAGVPVGGAWDSGAVPSADRRPARVRREFIVDKPVVRARLYATAHGVYEAEINGRRVGSDALSPGWTVYGQRLQYRTYDVTSHLAPAATPLARGSATAGTGAGWGSAAVRAISTAPTSPGSRSWRSRTTTAR
jgi:alpha-L-rhamnosidase